MDGGIRMVLAGPQGSVGRIGGAEESMQGHWQVCWRGCSFGGRGVRGLKIAQLEWRER